MSVRFGRALVCAALLVLGSGIAVGHAEPAAKEEPPVQQAAPADGDYYKQLKQDEQQVDEWMQAAPPTQDTVQSPPQGLPPSEGTVAEWDARVRDVRDWADGASTALPEDVGEDAELGVLRERALQQIERLDAAVESYAQARAGGDDRAAMERATEVMAAHRLAVGAVEALLDRLDWSGRSAAARLVNPQTLVVSGGVSLGSYQAGFLYMYTNFLRDLRAYMTAQGASAPNGSSAVYRAVTGASAGAINALLSAAYACAATSELRPEESVFYRTWIPVGIRDGESLLDEDAVTGISVFSRKPINSAISRIDEYWETPGYWTSEACSVDVGINATRYESRKLAVGDSGIEAPRQREQFVLRLEKGSGAEAPGFTVRRPVAEGDRENSELARFYPVLGHGEVDQPVPREDVMRLMKASSGFPFAFKPIDLDFQELVRKPGDESPGSRWGLKKRTRKFIDGGVFDNTPVGLALRLNRWAQRECQADGGGESDCDRRESLYVVLDVGDGEWETERVCRRDGKPCKQDDVPPNIIPFAFDFAKNFISSARHSQLLDAEQELAERRTTSPEYIRAMRPRMPTASEHLGAFLGFFEEDFRIFDFHLGMLDALAVIRDEFGQVHAQMMEADALSKVDSPLFECFEEYDEKSNAFRDRGVVPGKLAACKRYLEGGGASLARSEKVSRKNMLALLRVATDFRGWATGESYDGDAEVDRWLELLRDREYVYRDLFDGKSRPAWLAKRRIRGKLQDLVDKLAYEQDGFKQMLGVSIAGKAGANYFDYWSPILTAEVGLHGDRGIDLGLGILIAPFLRLRLGFRAFEFLNEYEDIHGTRAPGFTWMFTSHLVLTCHENPILQIEPFAGYGVAFPTSFDGGELVAWRQAVEPGVTFLLLQRIYLSLGATIYLDKCRNDAECSQLFDKFEGGRTPPLTTVATPNIALGWRGIW